MPTDLSRLSSRQHPVVRAFRQLATQADSTPDGRGVLNVLLDGAHLIREALAAKVRLRTVLVSTDFLDHATPSDRALANAAVRAGATVHSATTAVLDAASPVRTSSGIVAIAEWSPGARASTFLPAPAFVMGLVDVQDPGNVGAVIRSADALGATGVLALDGTAHPGGWKALRGAMGSTFRLPVARDSSAVGIAAARAAGLRVVAAVADAAQHIDIDEEDLTTATLVLLGNEGAGLPPELVASADTRVSIRMRPGVNSLNVAVTASIILYAAQRQRKFRIRNSEFRID